MKKEFTLRLDDAACAELENLKKLSGEKTDAKAIQCHWLGKRITPRKKPCKHYEVRENSDGKAIQ